MLFPNTKFFAPEEEGSRFFYLKLLLSFMDLSLSVLSKLEIQKSTEGVYWDMYEIHGWLTISISKNNIGTFPSKFQSYSLQVTSSSCFLDKLSNLKKKEIEGDFVHLAVETVSGQSQLWAVVGGSGDGFCKANQPCGRHRNSSCGQLGQGGWTRYKSVGMQFNVCGEVIWKTALVSWWKEHWKGV